jgi:hypothetical protein
LQTYWNAFISPPKGPPLGSREFTELVYQEWGIQDCVTGFEEELRQEGFQELPEDSQSSVQV